MRYYLGPWVKNPAPEAYWHAPSGVVGAIDLRSIPAQNTAGVGFFTTPDAVTLSNQYVQIALGSIDTFSITPAGRTVIANALGLASVSGVTLLDCLKDILTLRADPTGINRWKPLMPTIAGNLEIYLGGHSMIWSQEFDLAMPEAANVIAVLQEDYRAMLGDALAGKMGRNGVVDLQFHRRVLDSWGEKFRVSNPEDIFVPADLPKEPRLPHGTTITDNFNRADADALGNSSEGWSWTEVINDTDIVSNQAHSQGTEDCEARAESDLASSDHYGQVDVVNTTFKGGAFARFSASARTAYIGYLRATVTLRLSKNVSGTETLLSDAVITPALPEAYKIEANGSAIKVYQAGVQRLSITDTAITGNTRCGIYTRTSGSSNIVDNFSAADLAVAALATDLTDPALVYFG